MTPLVDPALETYAAEHSAALPPLLDEVRAFTYAQVEDAHMIVDRGEGAFLRLLVRLVQARRVLEVGTFTGYSALAMASALADDGRLITCELDPHNADIAQGFFDRSPDGTKIELCRGPALDSLRALDGPFDLIFLDADKENYPAYLELAVPRLRPGGLLVADNVLWSGRIIDATHQEETTRALRRFNDLVREDARLEPVLLTVRDGVSVSWRC
ncbi:MAG: O-methyltransferase [Pseudomonadota bacterium]